MPTVLADLATGMMFMLIMPEAMVIFREMMVRTETVSTPTALVGKFMQYFPTIMATVHYL